MRALAAGLALGVVAGAAQADCRLALVLALDVSASVNAVEYDLQALGMATALTSPEVVRAMLAPGAPVAVAVYHWSGPGDHALVADWTVIEGEAALNRLAGTLAAYPRRVTFDGRTAIGSSLSYAASLLGRAPDCRRQVIDIAADGENNAAASPETLRDSARLRRVTINALAVAGERALGKSEDWLRRYLEDSVIRGPGAFVEVADGYGDFARAMERKLLRELDEMAVSGLAAGDGHDGG
jgi:hypothetical protein